MAARSAEAAAARELSAIRARRAEEAANNRRLRGEAADAARRATAANAAQGWQLGIVRERHEQLLRPQPIAGEWRARNLQMQLKDSDAHLQALARAIRAASARLESMRARLAALEAS
jgi:hypothetical protein